MKIANASGRLTLITAEMSGGGWSGVDVERASRGRFGPDPQGIYERWDEFVGWAQQGTSEPAAELRPESLGSPAPFPRQVFGIGLNYASHAAETGRTELPPSPNVFTKFPTCISGPYEPLVLPTPNCDWEVELVVVIGRRTRRVTETAAWSHVAGVTVGQDVSERHVQNTPPARQFSLGKSFPGFGPMGPVLVSADELPFPDDLELGCSLDGETVQSSRTSNMIFSVPQLIASLSAVLTLLPGDVIFTGTPEGVGFARKPQRFLQPGEELVSWVQGVGTIRNRCVSATG